MTSSGYGSQAVSTLTLSSEDSSSIKSIEEGSEPVSDHHSHPQRSQRKSLGADSDDMDDCGMEPGSV